MFYTPAKHCLTKKPQGEIWFQSQGRAGLIVFCGIGILYIKISSSLVFLLSYSSLFSRDLNFAKILCRHISRFFNFAIEEKNCVRRKLISRNWRFNVYLFFFFTKITLFNSCNKTHVLFLLGNCTPLKVSLTVIKKSSRSSESLSSIETIVTCPLEEISIEPSISSNGSLGRRHSISRHQSSRSLFFASL